MISRTYTQGVGVKYLYSPHLIELLKSRLISNSWVFFFLKWNNYRVLCFPQLLYLLFRSHTYKHFTDFWSDSEYTTTRHCSGQRGKQWDSQCVINQKVHDSPSPTRYLQHAGDVCSSLGPGFSGWRQRSLLAVPWLPKVMCDPTCIYQWYLKTRSHQHHTKQ